MEALEGWEAMSMLENRWGREEAKNDRVGDKLLQLVKYAKELSTSVDKYVEKNNMPLIRSNLRFNGFLFLGI